MAVKKTITKNNITLVNKNSILQICLFIGLSFYMARCSSFQKAGQARLETGISRNSEVAKRQEITKFAKQYVGSTYKRAGRSPKGFDCSGFTHYVMKNFDTDLIPVSREQEKQGKEIFVSKVQAGDLLFFRRSKKGTVFHVALVVSNDNKGLFMVHSTSMRGVVVDNLTTNSYWKAKVVTARDVLSR